MVNIDINSPAERKLKAGVMTSRYFSSINAISDHAQKKRENEKCGVVGGSPQKMLNIDFESIS